MPLASVKARDDDRANVEPSAVAGISAFLGKLWKMVEDPKTDHLISWGKSGNTFVIKNQIDFAKTILPNYYKHNNIASFIRQLNMYGFHKIISTTSGSLDSNDNDEIEFTHPCFVRGHPYLLEQIKRKMNNPKENIVKTESSNLVNESIKRVFNDIKNLKGKQEYLGSQLCSVKQENEILWRELSLLRQKHAAQQNVLNKLISFLVSLAQPSSNHGLVKRRLVPLMLKDSASSSRARPCFYEGDHVYTFKKRTEPSSGTTIHEIRSDLSDDMQIDGTSILDENTPVVIEKDVASPASSVANSDLSISSSSPEPVPAALLLPSSRKGDRRMKKVYLTPGSNISSHFLTSQNRSGIRSKSPEYLVPEQTNNPLLELVHDTRLAADDDDHYVTIAANDDELEDAGITLKLIEPSDPNFATMRKRMLTRRRNPSKKETILTQTNAGPTSSKKIDRKKKPNMVAGEQNAEKVASENDFLFDLNLNNYSKPLIEVRTPKSNVSQQNAENATDIVNAFTTPEENLNIPITVEDMIDIPNATGSDVLQIELPASADNLQMVETSPNKRAEVRSSPVKQTNNAFGVENSIPLSGDATVATLRSTNAITSEGLLKQVNECADDAGNMKIACTENKMQPVKSSMESAGDIEKELSMQLDGVQSSLNNLKELMQSGGLALDMETLYDIFNEEPVDYNNVMGNGNSFRTDAKIEGNELTCNQPMFDFNDLLLQNDWSQPTTSYNTVDADYCNLNTPQIEENDEEVPPTFPPPTKKIRSVT